LHHPWDTARRAAAGEEWLKEAKLDAQRINKKDADEMKGFGRCLLESLHHIIQEKRKNENLEPTEKTFLRSLDLGKELNQDQEAPWKDKMALMASVIEGAKRIRHRPETGKRRVRSLQKVIGQTKSKRPSNKTREVPIDIFTLITLAQQP
jgi:hypothetical protein